jgi:FlaA1/EpsC-like NDP-sugar epimerase
MRIPLPVDVAPARGREMSEIREPFGDRLTRLVYKRATHAGIDAAILSATLFFSYLIRWDLRPPEYFLQQALALAPYVVASALLACMIAGVYDVVWRHVGTRDVLVLASALTVHTGVLVAFRIYLPDALAMLRMPLGVLAVNLGASFLAMAGVRLARRLMWEWARARSFSEGVGIRRVLIVGMGELGVTVAREVLDRPELGIRVVGFVDDDLKKSALIIHGLRVLGTSANLQRLVLRHEIDDVIITMPVRNSSAALSADRSMRDLAV